MQATRVNWFGLLLCAVLVGLGTVVELRAQEGAKATPPASPAALATGDRLKITFHEMIDVPTGNPLARAGTGADSMLRTFYQRMDLSAEYMIDEDGIVSLPRLGKFSAAGLLPRDLEAQLTTAFTRKIGRPADVNIAIQDRRPIYVVGAVKNGGAFKHTGRMTVLHAVALAGGIERGPSNLAHPIESVREQERVGKLTHQLKRLLARAARLETERSGSVAIEAPAQLISLAGKDDAEAVLSAEQTLLQLDQSRRRQQQAEAEAGVATARKEIEALRAKLVKLDAQSQIHGEHLADLRKLEGFTTRTSVIKLSGELSEIESRRQDIHATLAVAEARLAQAERIVARLSLDHATEIARSIAMTEAEIADVRLSLGAAGLLLSALGQGTLLNARGHIAEPIYEIVRQGKDASTVLPAQEGTQLLPGDVLKVRLESHRNIE
jgi:protein involved in polysaccharide export with SLBB domain